MITSQPTDIDNSAAAQLVEFYSRNGYMRVPDETRRKKESRTYKMGYEIRLVAQTKRELVLIRRLLRSAGLKPGKPYGKSNQWCQPIYGKQAMERFKQWIVKSE